MPTPRPKPAAGNGGAAAEPSAVVQESLTAVARMHERMMRQALAFNTELLDFARNRIGRDIETGERLAKCRDMGEAIELMTGFYRQAIDAYAEETRQLMDLGRKALADAVDETTA